MANLLTKLDGAKAYIGLLKPQEIEEANKLLEHLEEKIPKLEKELQKKYPKTKNRVYFTHEFGTELRKLVEDNDIKGYQEKIFWEQIREFASVIKVGPQEKEI